MGRCEGQAVPAPSPPCGPCLRARPRAALPLRRAAADRGERHHLRRAAASRAMQRSRLSSAGGVRGAGRRRRRRVSEDGAPAAHARMELRRREHVLGIGGR